MQCRHITAVVLFATIACAGARTPMRTDACLASPANRWVPVDGTVPRVIRVWIDEATQSLEGWSTYGRRRVRQGMNAWNVLGLPVRFEAASSGRDADVIVTVVDTLPGETASPGENQAGLTRLVYGARGELVRANVFVAVRARYGVRFSLPDQQATLLHELGHALGLPHASGPRSLMSAQRVGSVITGVDIALARTHYAIVPCPATGPTYGSGAP